MYLYELITSLFISQFLQYPLFQKHTHTTHQNKVLQTTAIKIIIQNEKQNEKP